MATEIDIVRDVSNKFEQSGIGYMLTGSMAMNYYAQPRMTRDIDVVVAIKSNDVERVAALFEPEYYVSKESIRESIERESIFNLIHHESVIKVDCIVRKQNGRLTFPADVLARRLAELADSGARIMRDAGYKVETAPA